ncbi:ubiquinol-cytochrome C reductase [Salmonella enterica]|nr:ubiquinol-cytochrome C reductase [Salmonella enterica]
MNIYNDLVRAGFSGKTKEELNAIDNHVSDALDDILMGMESVGKLMFWASDSENYTENLAAEDLRNIGGMLSSLMPICRALRDTADNASVAAQLKRSKD